MSQNKESDLDPEPSRARAMIKNGGARDRSDSRKRSAKDARLTDDEQCKRPSLTALWNTDTEKAPKSALEKTDNEQIIDLVKRSLQNPDVVKGLMPAIVESIQPVIAEAVSVQLASITNKLDKLLSVNSQTHPTTDSITKLEAKIDVIYENFVQLPGLIEQCKGVRTELDAVVKKNEKLNTTVNSLAYDLERKIEDLEQYGRRNALRFRNININDIPKIELHAGSPREDTDAYILQLVKDKLHVNVPDNAISRSHLLGPPREGKCSVIVKFSTYNMRQAVYSKRFLLREIGSSVFITEDLTTVRQTIVNELVKLRNTKKINRFWTKDGSVFLKVSESDRPVKIRDLKDLKFLK